MGNPAVPKATIEGRRGHKWGRRCVKMKGTQESSEGGQGDICTDIHNEKTKSASSNTVFGIILH